MQRYFHERGRSHNEALAKIRSKYGDNFRILTQKSIPAPGIMGLFGKEQVEYSGYVPAGREAEAFQKSRDERSRAAILAAAGKEAAAARKEAAAAKPEAGTDTVLKELRELKALALSASAPPPPPHPVLGEIEDILTDNEFDKVFIEEVTDALRRNWSAADLDERSRMHQAVAEMIAENMECSRPDLNPLPRVLVLAGPTGVGKTTTIAKLAAVHSLGTLRRKVRIITVDNYRIGARYQVEKYGEWMNIPVTAADSRDELKTQIALADDADLILVDTIGKSPKDGERIEEMRRLLAARGDESAVHLTLSAGTKSADLREILSQFMPFDYSSVIITKLDETSRVGNVLSAVGKSGASMSYLTDGQDVPMDIALASPARLLGMIRGLDFDPARIEEKYSAADITGAWR